MLRHLQILVLLATGAAPSGEAEGPLSAPLPAGVDASKKWKLVREADGKELPFQITGGTIFWIDSVPAEGKRSYRLEPGEPAVSARVECVEEKGKHLTLRAGGKDVLRYDIAVVEPPAGVNPAHASAGFIHPIWAPSGRVVSNNFPRGHEHHHGIWSAWRQAEFEGRKL